MGVNQFPPIHRTKPIITWYLWVPSLWHIIPVSALAFCSFCALLWPHQITAPSVLKFISASPLGITEILLQLVGQQTSRRSCLILSIDTSFIIIYTFNLALSLPSIVVIFPTKYSRTELYPHSAFYHSLLSNACQTQERSEQEVTIIS